MMYDGLVVTGEESKGGRRGRSSRIIRVPRSASHGRTGLGLELRNGICFIFPCGSCRAKCAPIPQIVTK